MSFEKEIEDVRKEYTAMAERLEKSEATVAERDKEIAEKDSLISSLQASQIEPAELTQLRADVQKGLAVVDELRQIRSTFQERLNSSPELAAIQARFDVLTNG